MPATRVPAFLAALLIGAAPTRAFTQPAATEPIARSEAVGLHCDGSPRPADLCARDLLRRLRAEAELDYVTRNALQATQAELEQVRRYDLDFRAHDRSQRSRKLAELDMRLAAVNLPPDERTRLETFRAILDRLAQYEADVDAGKESMPGPSSELMSHWVQQSKLETALYRRYGGTIGVNAAGPYAHGARAALVLDYVSQRSLIFLDAGVEAAFRRLITAPPAIVFRGAHPDFTPFWLRAIPSSYIPD